MEWLSLWVWWSRIIVRTPELAAFSTGNGRSISKSEKKVTFHDCALFPNPFILLGHDIRGCGSPRLPPQPDLHYTPPPAHTSILPRVLHHLHANLSNPHWAVVLFLVLLGRVVSIVQKLYRLFEGKWSNWCILKALLFWFRSSVCQSGYWVLLSTSHEEWFCSFMIKGLPNQS